MTSRHRSIPESDDRPAENPSRVETLSSSVPPHGGLIPAAGEYLKRIKVGRLETVAQWRRLVGKIMRAMLRGEMPIENGTKLIWAARVGADLAKSEQEQRALEELNEKLARLEGGGCRDPIAARPAGDLTDEELADIASSGRRALPAPNGQEGF